MTPILRSAEVKIPGRPYPQEILYTEPSQLEAWFRQLTGRALTEAISEAELIKQGWQINHSEVGDLNPKA